MPIRLTVAAESWPIAGAFTISRGAKTEARVVVVTLTEGVNRGRGECVPYARYGESVDGVMQTIESLRFAIERQPGFDRAILATALPAGAARNAVDCALWDLEAKRSGRRVHALAGLRDPQALTTAYTISLASPADMAQAAYAARTRPLLKLKLGAPDGDDVARLEAVRAAAPDSILIVDANEGWRADNLAGHIAACAQAGVRLIEQPLPADDDGALAGIARQVPICADESVHDRTGLAELRGRYDAVNIKLDKTGGLTEALATAAQARQLGFQIMVGCMVCTSLAIAPALLLAQEVAFVDLDGPLLLARDRPGGLVYESSRVHPPTRALWG